VQVTRLDREARDPTEVRDDAVVVEEPLEIRIAGETLAITMRTPGHDHELVMGYLLAERIIRSKDDVLTVTHCGRIGAQERENTIEVKLVPGVKTPLDDVDAPAFARRGTITSSACGVCGRSSIDDLLKAAQPIADGPTIPQATITAAVAALHDRQPIFAETGGCHAASLVTTQGDHVVTFEDVGRHNAVDKVIGAQLYAGALPLHDHLLVVSGRSSFEIVQKAIISGIPIVASVSAPSSLAIDLARRANVTLVGFTRGDAMTVYSVPTRVS
jgi:FdhD protein